MKNTGSGLGTESKSKWHQAVETMSYRNIAGGLADEMRGFIRPSEPRKCSPPFKMVIIDNCGTIVFECKVSKDGKVRPFGSARRVRDFHFPATALLPDSTFVTCAFCFEHATHGS